MHDSLTTQRDCDLATWTRDSSFYGSLDLLITIKSFDLQAIRRRHVASRLSGRGRTGSVERRPGSLGGVAHVCCRNGRMDQSQILLEYPEARGISIFEDRIALSSESQVMVVSDSGLHRIRNPWFSYIHSLDFSPDGRRLLIASSGFDCIFEYDTRQGEPAREWFAWENGFQKAVDPASGEPLYLTRHPQEALKYRLAGWNVALIDDPASQVLPTAKRAAFINSVSYDRNARNGWLATFFHDGSVHRIHPDTGKTACVLHGLSNPHGGRSYAGGYLATSTSEGRIVIASGNTVRRIDTRSLPGIPLELAGQEWLQNTIEVGDCLVVIDSNRTSLLILDLRDKRYDSIPYDENWAVQDMVPARNPLQIMKTLRHVERQEFDCACP